uniref:CNDH2_C domain-containing protein n=1 Tax=Parastrongyloides trichosuri TaxID=131310 RepID=A0A0N4ZNX6_PARTI
MDENWRNKFMECFDYPESKERVSELLLCLEKLTADMASRKVTINPHEFIQSISELVLKVNNLEQAIRLIFTGVKMNGVIVEKLYKEIISYKKLICFGVQEENQLTEEEERERKEREKIKRKEREMERKRNAWTSKTEELLKEFDEKREADNACSRFNFTREVIEALVDESNYDTIVHAKRKNYTNSFLERIPQNSDSGKIKRTKKKVERTRISTIHFDDAYFVTATSNYEEGNLNGLISLNARYDVSGLLIKINSKCIFKEEEYDLGKSGWFLRDFHTVLCECLKIMPSKELYRIHKCVPLKEVNSSSTSGFLCEKYVPMVDEINFDTSRNIFVNCIYIRSLSNEEAMNKFNIDGDLLEDLKMLTRGEGDFNSIMDKLKEAIPKKSTRELIWYDENFDITKKENLSKVFNPYDNFETIYMEFFECMTDFDEMKQGKYRKVVDSEFLTRYIYTRNDIPNDFINRPNKSRMVQSVNEFDLTEEINNLSLEFSTLDKDNEQPNESLDDIIGLDHNTIRSCRASSVLEEGIDRDTDVMEFDQQHRNVDQSYWSYVGGKRSTIRRPRSSTSTKSNKIIRKRTNSASGDIITPKSARILRSQSNSVSATPSNTRIKQEANLSQIEEDDEVNSVASPIKEVPTSDEEDHGDTQNESLNVEESTKNNDESRQNNDESFHDEDSDIEMSSVHNNIESSPTTLHTSRTNEEDGDETLRNLSPITTNDGDITICVDNDNIPSGRSSIRTPKPSQEIFNDEQNMTLNDEEDFVNYKGPFGNVFDEDELELRPIQSDKSPERVKNCVTEETAHSYGYMAMIHSDNANKIKCTTSVSIVNAPVVKLAIMDVLCNEDLQNGYYKDYCLIIKMLKNSESADFDSQNFKESFNNCEKFVGSLKRLKKSFRSTFQSRIKNPPPETVDINGDHSLHSLYHCVAAIVPQSKDSELHYLSFMNLLLHMNNKYSMTFVDAVSGFEVNGESPNMCFIRKV